MIIPEVVRIGSCDYEVILTDKVTLKESHQCYGHIDWEHHVIEIDKTLQDVQGLEHTFLHELVHGIVYERSLDLENSDEETIADELAKGLHQVIRDNPEMFLDDSYFEEDTENEEEIDVQTDKQ